MTRHCLLSVLAVGALACLPAAAPAQPTTAPAAAKPPAVDHVKDLFDLYSQGEERSRFFGAAGVEGELTQEEFTAAAGKPKSLVRAYDRWDAAIVCDKDSNGKLNWPEAEQYRQSVRQQVLSLFDKNKDGKLIGEERDAANRYLASGMRAPRTGPGRTGRGRGQPARRGQAGRGGDWQQQLQQLQAEHDADGDGQLSGEERRGMYQALRRRWQTRRFDRDNDGKLNEEETAAMEAEQTKAEQRRSEQRKRYQETIAQHDKDGDGKLSSDERRAMYEAYRAEQQKKVLQQWDANGNGKIDPEEREAQAEHFRKQAEEQRRQWMVRRHDKDGDGELNEQEQAAMSAEEERLRQRRERWTQQRRQWTSRWDADGDGQLSEEERKGMYAELRKAAEERRKEMDADGDGRVSGQEGRAYWEKLRDKYDADGDGQLSQDERTKMMQEEFGGSRATANPSRPRGARRGASRRAPRPRP